MRTRTIIIAVLVALPLVLMAVRRYALWYTVCAATSPDGTLKATVRCHYIPVIMDGRYHYYLRFDPGAEFRPMNGDHTLKQSASAVKNEEVTADWKNSHYIGYLQGFDGVPEREPSLIVWESPKIVVLKSRSGVAAKVELR